MSLLFALDKIDGEIPLSRDIGEKRQTRSWETRCSVERNDREIPADPPETTLLTSHLPPDQ